MNNDIVTDWTKSQVADWANRERLGQEVISSIYGQDIDGKSLLILSENDIRDLRDKYYYKLKISDIKRFLISVRTLQKRNQAVMLCMGLPEYVPPLTAASASTNLMNTSTVTMAGNVTPFHFGASDGFNPNEFGRISPPLSIDGRATSIKPEVFKTVISLGYAFLVTWITAFVMVVVHERVPDMKRYPPLPDIFLDNVPHIPWAFHMCEITGTLLFSIWSCVCLFHKHRLVLLRRFFALAGTVFLLRCVTMLITSLSVPGTHLQCNQNDYKVDDTNLTIHEAFVLRVSRAYTIWSGLGMSIQGVRTCGDYMFSGHTVALTLLNFFITEYTPRNLYFLHTMTWLLNMFGIFFILAAHEHYSIDVFVAFYISSRLFLYYHTLANNQALMSHDSNRTRIWFPMFSYFESSVDGIIPNEYDTISSLIESIFSYIVCIKDSFMLTTRRIWINEVQPLTNKTFLKTTTTQTAQTPTNQANSNTETLNNFLNNVQPNNLSPINQKTQNNKSNIVILNNEFKEENNKIVHSVENKSELNNADIKKEK